MTDITAIGEILIDLTQTGTNERGIAQFAANPGGAPANLAVAASRLGARTAFIGKVGNDGFGTILKETLRKNGVDVTGLVTDKKEATTLAVVSVDKQGERSFAFYRDPSADVDLTEEESLSALGLTRILHFGSLSLTTQPAYGATYAAIRAAKKDGALISYDPNYRPSIWNDEERAVRAMKEPLPLIDIIKVADNELPLLTGTEDPEEGSRILSEAGIRLIFITLGEKGAYYRYGKITGNCPGETVSVADTNGAGDTFFGAALSLIAKRGSLEGLTREELEAIVRFSNKAAAVTVSRPGAMPAMPTIEELS